MTRASFFSRQVISFLLYYPAETMSDDKPKTVSIAMFKKYQTYPSSSPSSFIFILNISSFLPLMIIYMVGKAQNIDKKVT